MKTLDSPMSKILMVQMKAQLGKGWTHCTDITPNELSKVSFKGCTDDQKDPITNGGYMDGATFRGVEHVDYDMKQSFQYVHQCIDTTELKDYIESQIPIEFNDTHVNEMLDEIRPNIAN